MSEVFYQQPQDMGDLEQEIISLLESDPDTPMIVGEEVGTNNLFVVLNIGGERKKIVFSYINPFGNNVNQELTPKIIKIEDLET